MVTEETPHIYRPTNSRIIFTFIGFLFFIGFLIDGGALLANYLTGNVGSIEKVFSEFTRNLLFTVTLGLLFLLVLLTNKNQLEIIITPSSISTSSTVGSPGKTVTISIKKLDKERLLRRTFWEKLCFKKIISSTDGNKIVISWWFFFSKRQRNEIIQDLLSLSEKV